MKAHLWVMLIATGIAMLGIAVFSNVPGHVEIAWRGVEYQTTLLVALLGLFAIILFSYLLLRALIGVLSLPYALSSLWQAKRSGTATDHLSIGLSAFVSEDWPLACRSLERVAPSQGSQAAHFMLLAARAAMEQNDVTRANQCLDQAKGMARDDAGKQALAYLRAVSPDEQGKELKPAQVAERLAAFLKKNPQHGAARNRLASAYQELGQLEQLEALFGKEKISEQQSDVMWQKRIWLRRLDNVGAMDAAARLHNLQEVWRELPRTISDAIECIARYLELMGLGAGEKGAALALQEIEGHLRKTWYPQLVRLYSLIPGEQVAAQIKAATAWQAAHQDDPDLSLCLGRLYLRQGALDKAAEQIGRAAKLRPHDADILSELARLRAAQGDLAQSHEQLVAGKRATASD